MILNVETTYFPRVKRGAARGGGTNHYVALMVPVEVATAALGDSQAALAYVTADGRRREMRSMNGRLYERAYRGERHADGATRLAALAGDPRDAGRWLIGLSHPTHGCEIVSPAEPGLTIYDKDGKARRDEEAKVRSCLAKVVLVDGDVWVERREPRYGVHVRPDGNVSVTVAESHGSGSGEFRLDEADAATEYARRVGNGHRHALPATLEFLDASFLSPPSHVGALVTAAKSACVALGETLPTASLEFMTRYVALREASAGLPCLDGTPPDAPAIRAALEDVMDELRASGKGWASDKARLALVEMDVADEFAAKADLEVEDEASLAFAP